MPQRGPGAVLRGDPAGRGAGQGHVPGLPAPDGVPRRSPRAARALGCLGWRAVPAGRGDPAQAAPRRPRKNEVAAARHSQAPGPAQQSPARSKSRISSTEQHSRTKSEHPATTLKPENTMSYVIEHLARVDQTQRLGGGRAPAPWPPARPGSTEDPPRRACRPPGPTRPRPLAVTLAPEPDAAQRRNGTTHPDEHSPEPEQRDATHA